MQTEKNLSLKTVCMIVYELYELIKKMELLHANGFIYRNVKPDNIVIGNGLDT